MNSLGRRACLFLLFVIVATPGFARATRLVRSGMWGGVHMSMQVKAGGTIIDFDCARGSIDLPIRLDRQSDFEVAGFYIQEHGGPWPLGVPPEIHPANYQGHVQNDKMFVTVTLVDSGEVIGSFTLMHDEPGQVFKCL